jgi:hypothetical protein
MIILSVYLVIFTLSNIITMKVSIEFAKAEYITKKIILKDRKMMDSPNYIKDVIDSFKNFKVKINDDSINGFKTAVMEILSKEQTFHSIRSFDYWENMNANNYKINIPEKIFE